MAKPYTFPTLLDDAKQISITKLKEWKYLEGNQIINGTIKWSRNGQETGKISITVNTKSKEPFLELNYVANGEQTDYKIKLIQVKSNLGKGFIWYFLCPTTNKRCRILYLVGRYFLHREAFKNCMYESQIQSKQYRVLNKQFKEYFKVDLYYSELYKKHFKKTYKGKPTKRYLHLKRLIEKAEFIPFQQLKNNIL